jgi:hypothetical protein
VCRYEPEQLRAQLRDPNRKREAEARAAQAAAKNTRGNRRDRDDEEFDDGSEPPVAAPPERTRVRSGAEIEALRLLLQRPTEIASDLGPWLFTEGPARRAYQAVADAGSLHDAIDEADPVVADLLTRLSVEESQAEPDDVVVRLVDSAATAVVAQMENEARQAEDPLDFVPALQWLKLNLDQLRGDEPAMDAVHQLLAWLEEHAAELSR